MHRLASILSLTLLIACGTGGNDGSDGAGNRDVYPAGPYGIGVGSTLDNLEFVAEDGAPLPLDALFFDRGNRLLLINTAAGWCTACIEEMPALNALELQHSANGLAVLVAVFEDENFVAADAAYAASWRSRYNLDALVVADPTFLLGAYYDVTLTPMNMIVDVDGMEILEIMVGWDPDLVDAIIEARL